MLPQQATPPRSGSSNPAVDPVPFSQLTQDGIPTAEEATKRINKMTWDDQTDLLTEASDEVACLQAIMEAHIRVDGRDWHGDVTVGELIGFLRKLHAPAITHEDHPGILRDEARRALGMYGIRVEMDRQTVLISNQNGMLARKIMAYTPWPQGWGKLLGRLPGASKRDQSVDFAGGRSRVTEIAWEEIDANNPTI